MGGVRCVPAATLSHAPRLPLPPLPPPLPRPFPRLACGTHRLLCGSMGSADSPSLCQQGDSFLVCGVAPDYTPSAAHCLAVARPHCALNLFKATTGRARPAVCAVCALRGRPLDMQAAAEHGPGRAHGHVAAFSARALHEHRLRRCQRRVPVATPCTPHATAWGRRAPRLCGPPASCLGSVIPLGCPQAPAPRTCLCRPTQTLVPALRRAAPAAPSCCNPAICIAATQWSVLLCMAGLHRERLRGSRLSLGGQPIRHPARLCSVHGPEGEVFGQLRVNCGARPWS